MLVSCLFVPSVVFSQIKLEINNLNYAAERSIHQSAFEYSKTDTFSYDVKITFTGNDTPKFYYTKLITPVCESGQCYLVAIKIYWDLAGTYLAFELPPNRVLTKMDHEHFAAADYQKLERILGDPQWPLSRYSISELIVDSTKMLVDSNIDAYTGATAPFVRQQDNIPGALYTIYTLWEFVHDQGIIQNLQDYTMGLVRRNKLGISDFLASERASYWGWAIENADASDIDATTQSLIMNIILLGDQYLAYEALELVDVSAVPVQRQLWELFKGVTIAKKRDILNRLLSQKIVEEILVDAKRYYDQSDDPMEKLLVKKLMSHGE